MTAARSQDLLYHECGLKGLSGISNDVRELEASSEPRRGFALDHFAYRIGSIRGHAGGGAGRSRRLRLYRRHRRKLRRIRARFAERLGWLGATIDPAANAAASSASPRGTAACPLCGSDRRRADDRAAYLVASIKAFLFGTNDDWGGIPGDIGVTLGWG